MKPYACKNGKLGVFWVPSLICFDTLGKIKATQEIVAEI